MSIRPRGNGWQVRVPGWPDTTVATKEAAETIELDRKLKNKLGVLARVDATTFGEELDAHLARKLALGGRRGKLRPTSVRFYEHARWSCSTKPAALTAAVLLSHKERGS